MIEKTNEIATLANKNTTEGTSLFSPAGRLKLRVHFALGAQDFLSKECPNPPGNADTIEDSAENIHKLERWKIHDSYFYSILFLAPSDGA